MDCGPSPETRVKRLQQWHKFFAIWPRRVGEHDCRFLETIERRGRIVELYEGGVFVWEYRAKEAA